MDKNNCGNCIHSSIEVFEDNMIACEIYKRLEKFEAEKESFDCCID